MQTLPALKANALKSATRYCETSLTATLPKWLQRADIDVPGRFYPPVVPYGQGDALRASAAHHAAALEPCGKDRASELLEHLRFVTKLNSESEFEKRATMKSLVANLQSVPQDILVDALAAYINALGERWFPKSPGEIRTFTDAPTARRRLRIDRLNTMAEISDATADPAAVRSSWDAPISLDQVEAENKLFKSVGSTPEALGRIQKEDAAKWEPIVKASGFTAD